MCSVDNVNDDYDNVLLHTTSLPVTSTYVCRFHIRDDFPREMESAGVDGAREKTEEEEEEGREVMWLVWMYWGHFDTSAEN